MDLGGRFYDLDVGVIEKVVEVVQRGRVFVLWEKFDYRSFTLKRLRSLFWMTLN